MYSWLIDVIGLTLAMVLLILVGGSVYLVYVHNRYSHLPGPPRSNFFLGHFPEIQAYVREGKLFLDYFRDMYEQHGPIYVLFLAHKPVVLITDPAYIKKVFIDSQKSVYKDEAVYSKLGFVYGERAMGYGLVTNTDPSSWRRRRQIIGQAFHRQHLKKLMLPFNKVADRLLTRLDSCAAQCKEVGMLQELANTTLDIIAQVGFGLDIKSIWEEDSPFRKAHDRMIRGMADNILHLLPSWLLKVYQCSFLQSEIKRQQIEGVRFIRDFARLCVSQRLDMVRKGEDVADDILSYIVKCSENDALTIEDLMDEFVTIFFAGHETTASSLAFTLFEVITNPEIEQKILEEVREVIGDKDCVDYNDLAQLKYVGQCVTEGLRKFTIVPGPGGYSTKDIVIGGLNVPSGCLFEANKYAIAQSSNYWKKPTVFDPDRFASPENISNLQCTYFPFSLGPRNCVGQTFAMFELKVLLARMIKKFKFRLLPGQTSKAVAKTTLSPKDGGRCTVELR